MVLKWLQGKKAEPTQNETSRAGGAPLSGTNAESPAGTISPEQDAGATAASMPGLEMTDAYYPRHDPIDFYGNGGFRFGSMSHQGAILFLPSGIHRWDVETVSTLEPGHFQKLQREATDIEILLIGTGLLLTPIKRTLTDSLRREGVKIDVMDTGAAVRTLNILLSEDRAVAAALFPVT